MYTLLLQSDDNSLHEHRKHSFVHWWVAPGVEDGQEDQTASADYCEYAGANAQSLLGCGIVVRQAAPMS